ncbi:MAG: Stp1/IreP family PP2C-type Ser/Thr phosphatase [Rhodocyclaceae bacterium]|nr:Stp1/IreP family PP2C-type Ser/Thr phosphatase [Rhodocyclaceae bacterium]
MNLSDALEIATASDMGQVRSNNEDAVLANAHAGFVVLADGMGGYNAGEVASGMATALLGVELEKKFVDSPPQERTGRGECFAETVLRNEIVNTNRAIYNASQEKVQYAGMGTTLVVAIYHDNKVTVAHIGDSRLYRLRGDEFSQVTRDHSLLQEQIDNGIISTEEARYSQNKNLVTRALGVDAAVEPEIHTYDVRPGDVYLLCSDGLNDMVDDEEIGATLRMLGANLALCATQLVQLANDNGGRDNVSVILVKIKQPFPAQRSWLRKLLDWFEKK